MSGFQCGGTHMFKKLLKRIIEKIYIPIGTLKRNKISRHNFTIISNNCWAGSVYREYNLEYCSPTIGLYFFPEEFLKFVSDIKKYLEADLIFINAKESMYYKELKLKNQLQIPIGKILDVEIVFLHYKNEEEAKNKWDRRKKRVNYNYILYKFNDQNFCTREQLEIFDKLNLKNKLCFVSKSYDTLECAIRFDRDRNYDSVRNDTSLYIYRRYIKTSNIINNLEHS